MKPSPAARYALKDYCLTIRSGGEGVYKWVFYDEHYRELYSRSMTIEHAKAFIILNDIQMRSAAHIYNLSGLRK